MNRRESLVSQIFENQVKMMLGNGLSVSQISKRLGKSYKHTKQIADRLAQESNASPESTDSKELNSCNSN